MRFLTKQRDSEVAHFGSAQRSIFPMLRPASIPSFSSGSQCPTSKSRSVPQGVRRQADPADDRIEIPPAASDHVWATIVKSETARRSCSSFRSAVTSRTTRRSRTGRSRRRRPRTVIRRASGGYWFRDPFGLLVQVWSRRRRCRIRSRHGRLNVPPMSAARQRVRPPGRSASTRLSHMALFTPTSIASSTSTRGRSGSASPTARATSSPSPMPPRLGPPRARLRDRPGLGLHHSSWDVPSVEELGLANTQLRAAGYNIHWGPGRHVLGSNYFNYTADK